MKQQVRPLVKPTTTKRTDAKPDAEGAERRIPQRSRQVGRIQGAGVGYFLPVDGIGWNVDEPAFQNHFLSDFQTVLDGGAWPPELAEVPPAELAEFLRNYVDTNAFAGIVEAETGRESAIAIALTGSDRAERAFGQYMLRLATTYRID